MPSTTQPTIDRPLIVAALSGGVDSATAAALLVEQRKHAETLARAVELVFLALPHGVAAEYAITPNLVATVAPFSFGFSQAPEGLVISSLTEIDVLAGLAWRR